MKRSPEPVPQPVALCELGDGCFRVNEIHLSQFAHPHLTSILSYTETHSGALPEGLQLQTSMKTLQTQLETLRRLMTEPILQPQPKRQNFEELKKEIQSQNEASKREISSIICCHGEKCYRRNPQHFMEFSHPHIEEMLKKINYSVITKELVESLKPQLSWETAKIQLEIVKGMTEKSHPAPSGSPSKLESSQSLSSTSKLSEEQRRQNEKDAEKSRVVILDRVKDCILGKIRAAEPYGLFMSTISGSVATHSEKLSLTFAELLDPKLGELKSSLQINFMVQLGWLLAQYHVMGSRGKPLTLFYGDLDVDIPPNLNSFITSFKVVPPNSFGSHHSKMMVFEYTDGSIRVVVCTANLVESDWDNRTQGVWVSPRCPQLPEGSDTTSGESPTRFKSSLIRYLSAYKRPELVSWIHLISTVDMSAIKVFFVASIPGTHRASDQKLWGHTSLASILSEEVVVPDKNKYPVVVQCSSIGSLGPKPESWLCGEMLRTFTSGRKEGLVSSPPLRFIYPTFEDIAQSYDGLLGGGCLPYRQRVHCKQEWLIQFLCRWKSDSRHRTRAPPHIKSYCRVSPDLTKLSYFVLTSANMSKAAWGQENRTGLCILSYETGVLFLPKYFGDIDYFPLKDTSDLLQLPTFPMPYDLPPTPYSHEDVPWFMDNIL